MCGAMAHLWPEGRAYQRHCFVDARKFPEVINDNEALPKYSGGTGLEKKLIEHINLSVERLIVSDIATSIADFDCDIVYFCLFFVEHSVNVFHCAFLWQCCMIIPRCPEHNRKNASFGD